MGESVTSAKVEMTPAVVLSAYARGFFPMAHPLTGRIAWYSPDPRSVLPLDGLRVTRSLRRTIRRGEFEVSADGEFAHVIEECAATRLGDDQIGTWINAEIVKTYCELHRIGIGHSVEARRGGRLVGGLYGLAIGGGFFGESMFCRPESGGTDASKVCLAALVDHLRARGYVLLDSQIVNPHMASMGAIEIPRREFLRRLETALARADVTWGEFEWEGGRM